MSVIPISNNYGLDVLFNNILENFDLDCNSIVIIIDKDKKFTVHSKCEPMEMAFAAALLNDKSVKDF